MSSGSPEQRFEVPPEYAEVYERAYRRAYEEGQGTLGSALVDVPQPPVRGKRAAIPEQRTPRRSERTGTPERQGGARARRPGAEEGEPVGRRRGRRRGRRADRRAGSTLLPLLGLGGLVALMLVGSFILGRVTATVEPGTEQAGVAGATASATQGLTSSTTYDGATRLARVSAVTTGCTAAPGTDSTGRRVTYDVRNVVDGDPETAWRCDGVATGQVITFQIEQPTKIVQVGIVPGFARSDPSTGADQFAAFNRITKVAWILSDGVTVEQDLGDDPLDRSLRTLAVPPTVTGTVGLKILDVSQGDQDATMISTVELYTPAS